MTQATTDNARTRELYPMSCAAYDCYWSAKTPGEERIARLLIAVTRRLEGRGDTDPHTGQLLSPCPRCDGSIDVCGHDSGSTQAT